MDIYLRLKVYNEMLTYHQLYESQCKGFCRSREYAAELLKIPAFHLIDLKELMKHQPRILFGNWWFDNQDQARRRDILRQTIREVEETITRIWFYKKMLQYLKENWYKFHGFCAAMNYASEISRLEKRKTLWFRELKELNKFATYNGWWYSRLCQQKRRKILRNIISEIEE